MPVYLCKPGWGTAEPWKHGVSVFAHPFPAKDETTARSDLHSGVDDSAAPMSAQNRSSTTNAQSGSANRSFYTRPVPSFSAQRPEEFCTPIRRVRHSEVVLVDEVSVHYSKYWLRLRWPGSRGGVAGYILLGGTNSVPNDRAQEWKDKLKGAVGGIECYNQTVGNHLGSSGDLNGANEEGENHMFLDNANFDFVFSHCTLTTRTADDENDVNDKDEYEDNLNDSDNESMQGDSILRRGGSSGSPHFAPRCESTGIYFPSTTTMELLALYDDGVESAPSVASIAGEDGTDDDGESGEPVFCRICREGLHDVEYHYEMEGQEASINVNNSAHDAAVINAQGRRKTRDVSTSGHSDNASQRASIPPISAQQTNHPYAANPLMAPCECSGSMAFVHYLCIEQWRCRSNHPGAKNGLNCETCNTSYTLPPPASRPDVNEEEDFLEAMAPHVLAALRRPHPVWQIGAAVVRRKWLRPIAPVLMSPIVALYCRARRTLKKRGVSRRRWACSLCRRRARWKCVRCLRSYYCSRQCQNVSWHIVHKHVCYKPVRFWSSVVVYCLAFVYFLPGVLSYPLMYDLGLSFLWLSFVVTGVIGGGIATIMKKQMGVDIRGRGLEALVVISTFWLASICWGLVWAFFGESNGCKGVLNYNVLFGETEPMETSQIDKEDYGPKLGLIPSIVSVFVLRPAKKSLSQIDSFLWKLGPFITKWICQADDGLVEEDGVSEQTCLELTSRSNPNFLATESSGNRVSDVNTVAAFWTMAIFMHFMSYATKRMDRIRRAAAARQPRPHQD